MTLIQSRSSEYRIFNFEMHSLVIKIALLVNRAVLDGTAIPAPGLIKPIVELLIVEADPNIVSVIINNTFLFFKFLYFFF